MHERAKQLAQFLVSQDGLSDKSELASDVQDLFALTRDRSVYYCNEFAIRFSSSRSENFANTVLSLSNLQKVDDRPFFVCVVLPDRNIVLLANTTFLRKISHSSQELRVNNIRGSFNGSDILRSFEGITNVPENFERLFDIHGGLEFKVNLARLVEATNNISPTGKRFEPSVADRATILAAPARANSFAASAESGILANELDERVARFSSEILLAALIENVNVRGRIIEYLIAGQDEKMRDEIVSCLKNGSNPRLETSNALGDYAREFPLFATETDVKTKIMVLNSNPKAYNIDKMLEFLTDDRSVFLFYFVGVEVGKPLRTVLVSVFQEDLISATMVVRHWAGRNSRGVSQFEGRTLGALINTPRFQINEEKARGFLEDLLSL